MQTGKINIIRIFLLINIYLQLNLLFKNQIYIKQYLDFLINKQTDNYSCYITKFVYLKIHNYIIKYLFIYFSNLYNFI